MGRGLRSAAFDIDSDKTGPAEQRIAVSGCARWRYPPVLFNYRSTAVVNWTNTADFVASNPRPLSVVLLLPNEQTYYRSPVSHDLLLSLAPRATAGGASALHVVRRAAGKVPPRVRITAPVPVAAAPEAAQPAASGTLLLPNCRPSASGCPRPRRKQQRQQRRRLRRRKRQETPSFGRGRGAGG